MKNFVLIDIIQVIISMVLIILTVIVLIDVKQNEDFMVYIILAGGIINMLIGIKGLLQKNSKKYLLPVSAILYIMCVLIFFGFGGF